MSIIKTLSKRHEEQFSILMNAILMKSRILIHFSILVKWSSFYKLQKNIINLMARIVLKSIHNKVIALIRFCSNSTMLLKFWTDAKRYIYLLLLWCSCLILSFHCSWTFFRWWWWLTSSHDVRVSFACCSQVSFFNSSFLNCAFLFLVVQYTCGWATLSFIT